MTDLARRFRRVAIAHEWLTIPGGSERVVMALLELFPGAEIFTSVYDPAPWPKTIRQRPVHVSFLNRVPRATRIYPKLVPLMSAAFRSFDLRGFDLVISSNHCSAKSVIVPSDALHVCYCHTPMRYAWEPRFLEGESIGPLASVMARLLLGRLRRQDAAAARGPDAFVANSRHVAGRIRRYYGREARIIHPPVDIEPFLRAPRAPGDYYLYLGRLVPYKRADLALAACAALGRPLKIVGGGRDARRLDAGGADVELLGNVPAEDLPGFVAGARALLFPGEEDFGMVPVEAQAAGVPVIAYAVGGARESVRDGETGVLFGEQTVEALCEAIVRFERMTFDEQRLRDNARRFAAPRFAEQLESLLLELSEQRVVSAKTATT